MIRLTWSHLKRVEHVNPDHIVSVGESGEQALLYLTTGQSTVYNETAEYVLKEIARLRGGPKQIDVEIKLPNPETL